jgi:DNA polymerase-1
MNKTLVLFDGMAILYRAFYAIRELSTRSGRPTNAVFGFIKMMKQIKDIWKPTHWLVAFDGGLPRSRLQLHEEYKSQRPTMPDALKEQIPSVERYLDGAGVNWTRMQGEEADDIIACAAGWATHEADAVLIATSDKDMYQLVTDRIRVISVSGGAVPMGPQEVKRKTGVEPSQIVDWLSLVGDASDNIPGVPGVGPKTAAKLLEQYGNIGELMEHLKDLPQGRIRDAIGQSKDVVLRNMALIRLKADMECQYSWEMLRVRQPDAGKLVVLFKELEFDSMVREMSQTDLFNG